MKNIKRHLSLLCVVALALAVMVPTVFAATKSYDISYDFTLGSGDGSPTTYDGKDAKDFWYPGNGSATWSIEVSSKSETYVKSAKLYYIRSLSSDVQVETLELERPLMHPSLQLTGKHIMQLSLQQRTSEFTERQL